MKDKKKYHYPEFRTTSAQDEKNRKIGGCFEMIIFAIFVGVVIFIAVKLLG